MRSSIDENSGQAAETLEHHRVAIESLAANMQKVVDETAFALRGHLDLIDDLYHHIEALTLVNRTLASLAFRQQRLEPNYVFAVMAPTTDNPIARERARRIFGARPRFRVIEGGKSGNAGTVAVVAAEAQ